MTQLFPSMAYPFRAQLRALGVPGHRRLMAGRRGARRPGRRHAGPALRRASPPSPACPRWTRSPRWDIAVVGVPFDGGTTLPARGPLRAGRRAPGLAPAAALQPRARHPARSSWPRWSTPATSPARPSSTEEAVAQIEAAADALLRAAGGWWRSGATTPSPCRCCGPRAGVTARWPWCTSTPISTRGTPTSASASPTGPRSGGPGRRASSCRDHSTHVGLRGPLYSGDRPRRRRRHGLRADHAPTTWRRGAAAVVAAAVLERVGDAPVYVSVDIDVLDPAHAPGTGTPEAGGLTSRELLALRAAACDRRVDRRAATWWRSPRPTTTPRSRRSPPRTCSTSWSPLMARRLWS